MCWRAGLSRFAALADRRLLAVGYSIVFVALITSLGVILLSYTSRATRLTPSRIGDALESTARATCSLSATCACAGLIIGAIFSTGLSVQITQGVMSIAQNNLWLILLLAAVIALVLGTGLTASAVYITMVATVVPLLKAAGVPTVAAHMFAFYYGVVSDITPPTALAAVAASGLARANPDEHDAARRPASASRPIWCRSPSSISLSF